jgi:RNA polymerase sigma factor (sigma-70 family)
VVTGEPFMHAMSRNDQTTFEAFIDHYYGPLSGYLERMLQDSGKAEDVVQETFIKLIRQIRENPAPENTRAWLYKVASNLCRDYWRSASYRSERTALPEVPERLDKRPSVAEIYERRETRKEIIQSLNQLTETQREIVILRFYQDLKLIEIAEVLNLPLGTVKSRLFHALKQLKKQLTEKESEEI